MKYSGLNGSEEPVEPTHCKTPTDETPAALTVAPRMPLDVSGPQMEVPASEPYEASDPLPPSLPTSLFPVAGFEAAGAIVPRVASMPIEIDPDSACHCASDPAATSSPT